MDENTIKVRIDALLSIQYDRLNYQARSAELLQGAISVLQAVHGNRSQQIESLTNRVAAIERGGTIVDHVAKNIFDVAQGTLRNLKGELDSGLLGTLSRTVTGEVLSDFLQLAKAALDHGDDKSKNVAGVLAAAAFEDTIRRMGSTFCGILTRDELPGILAALKAKGILVGAQFGTVQAQLQFRNDALHADWHKIDVVGVRTVLELVQALLLKHFS